MWQPGSAPHKVVLRGATKQETSSKQVLQQAKEERAKRKQARDEPRAALAIQSAWRGKLTREAARTQLQSDWLERYGSLAAKSDAAIPPSELVDSIVPLALQALLPPLGPQRAALEAGGELQHLSETGKKCLRGAMYLLLTYLTSRNSKPGSENASTPALPPGLLMRCATLCCGAIGGDADVLTQTAAARVLSLITASCLANFNPLERRKSQDYDKNGDKNGPTEPTTPPSNNNNLDNNSGGDLCRWLAPRHMIPLAARRLLDALSDSSKVPPSSQAYKQLLFALSNVVSAQFNVIDRAIAALKVKDHDSGSGGGGSGLESLKLLVLHVLTGPEVLRCLSGAASAARLMTGDTFYSVAECATGLVSTPEFGREIRAGPAVLRLLTSLTGFLTTSQQDGKNLATEERCAAAFTSAARVLGDKIAALNTASASSTVFNSSDGEAALEAAVRVFGDGPVALKLQTCMALPRFCQLYWTLLNCAEAQSKKGGGGATLRLLSALAFGSGAGKEALLPRVWRWLALNIGLPLDVAANATAFEIPSLPKGVRSVPQHAQQPFALFCRALAHYLGAADDVEFYEEQGLFTLAQQRAVAAGLTALVFRTHIPRAERAGSLPTTGKLSTSGSGGADDGGRGEAALLHHAPRLLRVLYDRDSRHQFCPPALWLSPYNQVVAAGKSKTDISGAAVLRALLQMDRGAQEDEDSSEIRTSAMSRAAGHAGPSSASAHSSFGDLNSASTSGTVSGTSGGSTPTGLAALLLQAPQCIPFEERVEVFRGLIALDKQARRYDVAPVDGGPRPIKVAVRRTRLLEDALAALVPAGGSIRGPLNITFIDARGMTEAGIDMGGLTKELLETVTAAILQPDRGIFAQTPDGSLFPHPLAHTLDEGRALFTLSGLILGKALYESILLPVPLAPFFVARLQGRLPTLDDLEALDSEVFRSLAAVKRYPGDATDLGLDFTVERDVFGAKVVEELVPGGGDVDVTTANKLQYVHLVADWHLRRRLGPSSNAFAAGLGKVIPLVWLRLFSAKEVNQLLGGGDGGEIDIEDLRNHAQYSGGYSASSRTVQLFWSVVRKLGREDRRALLRFATSSSRGPLGGFAYLSPPFTIHKVDCGGAPLAIFGGKDVDRLPTASTCANTLKLPNFKRESTLREKLLYAIRSGAGFDLS